MRRGYRLSLAGARERELLQSDNGVDNRFVMACVEVREAPDLSSNGGTVLLIFRTVYGK